MSNPPPTDGMNDDFFDQIFSMPAPDAAPPLSYTADSTAAAAGFAAGGPSMFSLGLSLDQQRCSNSDTGGKRTREDSNSHSQFDPNSLSSEPPPEREQHPVQLSTLFPSYGHAQLHQIRPNPSPQVAHGQGFQSSMAAASQPPAPRPRARARRGQATDPHSIAERLRRERIAERVRALQELVPSTNKTDRAAMLDEVVDYVKFLRLQVKVLSMSRLGGAGAVAQLVTDIPLSSVEGDNSAHQLFDKWSTDGTELRVAKLMEEDIGAAMQLLQSKSLCVMPMSLAAAIFHTGSQPGPEHSTPSSC